ncbi:MAG TPA: inorganic diphosphatase [Vicinamibacterales bacterium]|nr:inorganic diphosphatase [Vicinamibacterales bacterium]
MAKRPTLADPSALKPSGGDDKVIRVVIETPKGSCNKYAFEAHDKVFVLKKVLPSGMAFPYDFGFIPSTLADDGDPVDVLVLMDEPAFTGCVLERRPIGVIEGEQTNDKKTIRNDRIVAVEGDAHTYTALRHLDDLGKPFLRELEEFFVNYHGLSKTKYRIVDARGPKEAHRRIQAGIKRHRRKR